MRIRFFVKLLFVLIALMSIHSVASATQKDEDFIHSFYEKQYAGIISSFNQIIKNGTDTLTSTDSILMAACYFALNKTEKAQKIMTMLDVSDTMSWWKSIRYNLYASYLDFCNPRESIKWYMKASKSDTSEALKNLCSIVDVYQNKLNMHDSALYFAKMIESKTGIMLSEFKFEDDGWVFVTTSGINYLYRNKKIAKTENGTYLCWEMYDWDGKRGFTPLTFWQDFLIQKHENKIMAYWTEEDSINYLKRIDSIKQSQQNVYKVKYLEEYDFNKNLSRSIESVTYGEHGDVITPRYFDNSKELNEGWSHIVPGTKGETELEAVKKEVQKQSEKEKKQIKPKRKSKVEGGI